jgi:hypothetical protein
MFVVPSKGCGGCACILRSYVVYCDELNTLVCVQLWNIELCHCDSNCNVTVLRNIMVGPIFISANDDESHQPTHQRRSGTGIGC